MLDLYYETNPIVLDSSLHPSWRGDRRIVLARQKNLDQPEYLQWAFNPADECTEIDWCWNWFLDWKGEKRPISDPSIFEKYWVKDSSKAYNLICDRPEESFARWVTACRDEYVYTLLAVRQKYEPIKEPELYLPFWRT